MVFSDESGVVKARIPTEVTLWQRMLSPHLTLKSTGSRGPSPIVEVSAEPYTIRVDFDDGDWQTQPQIPHWRPLDDAAAVPEFVCISPHFLRVTSALYQSPSIAW